MTLSAEPVIEVLLPAGGDRTLPQDTRIGLSADPKSIPPKHFYDEVGSELFEQITELPSYYPTRAEREILISRGAELAALTETSDLVELGSGSADKALLLIEPMLATGGLQRYLGVDVSESALRSALKTINSIHPELQVRGAVADMTRQLAALPPAVGRRSVALLGGTVGNFPEQPRRRLLKAIADLAGPDGRVIIGFDKVKDPAILVAAYDEPEGVTARFNLNLLTIINRELGADFNPADFEHVALWNEDEEWIEMRLRARRPISVAIDGLGVSFEFAAGEEILTETSAKFTRQSVSDDLTSAGMEICGWFEDSESRFALAVAKPMPAAAQ
ncbi:MAG: L-histidine N(alpha)-methyltransferase [Solirubrobacterales bacterium]|nr:L-histidine N(alpha)-methyltransferase [Solirubrobacterales bacterium]